MPISPISYIAVFGFIPARVGTIFPPAMKVAWLEEKDMKAYKVPVGRDLESCHFVVRLNFKTSEGLIRKLRRAGVPLNNIHRVLKEQYCSDLLQRLSDSEDVHEREHASVVPVEPPREQLSNEPSSRKPMVFIISDDVDRRGYDTWRHVRAFTSQKANTPGVLSDFRINDAVFVSAGLAPAMQKFFVDKASQSGASVAVVEAESLRETVIRYCRGSNIHDLQPAPVPVPEVVVKEPVAVSVNRLKRKKVAPPAPEPDRPSLFDYLVGLLFENSRRDLDEVYHLTQAAGYTEERKVVGFCCAKAIEYIHLSTQGR